MLKQHIRQNSFSTLLCAGLQVLQGEHERHVSAATCTTETHCHCSESSIVLSLADVDAICLLDLQQHRSHTITVSSVVFAMVHAQEPDS